MWLLPLFQSPAKCALIAGITGQDGSYLEEWLLAQGYEAQGVVRGVALEDPDHRLSRLSGPMCTKVVSCVQIVPF